MTFCCFLHIAFNNKFLVKSPFNSHILLQLSSYSLEQIILNFFQWWEEHLETSKSSIQLQTALTSDGNLHQGQYSNIELCMLH